MRRFRMLRLLFAVIFLSVFMTNAAMAQGARTGMYAGVRIIDSIQGHFFGDGADFGNWNNTIGGGIFFGYDFFHKQEAPLRLEVEYAIRSNFTADEQYNNGYADLDIDYSLNLQTLLANAYLDLHNRTPFTPYVSVGAGLGFVHESMKVDITNRAAGYTARIDGDGYGTVFAYQVGAGVAYAASDQVSIDLGYRFLGLSNSDSYQDYEDTFSGAHEINLGLRFGF